MPASRIQVKIFESNSITVIEKQVNDFLNQFSVVEIKGVSITLSEKLFYVIVVFTI